MALYSLAALTVGAALRRDPTEYAAFVPAETGDNSPIVVSAKRRVRFLPPATRLDLVVALETRDGRRFDLRFDPEREGTATARIPGRGAYRAPNDRLELRDLFSLFVAARAVPAVPESRVAILPAPLFGPPAPSFPSGDPANRTDPASAATDAPTEHRPYVPGEDPRRLDWKLYARFGELIVRVGDPEPPVGAAVEIYLDESVDPSLFGTEAARGAVDRLCSAALAAVIEFEERGVPVRLGYNGTPPLSVDGSAAARLLAYPAAAAPGRTAPLRLPVEEAGEARGRLVFALPAAERLSEALGQFLADTSEARSRTTVMVLIPESVLPELGGDLHRAALATAGACRRERVDASLFRA